MFAICSSAHISQLLGMPASSVKNANELIDKNAVKKRLNIRLPTGDMSDKGSPHKISTGSEISVKNRCRCMNFIAARFLLSQ